MDLTEIIEERCTDSDFSAQASDLWKEVEGLNHAMDDTCYDLEILQSKPIDPLLTNVQEMERLRALDAELEEVLGAIPEEPQETEEEDDLPAPYISSTDDIATALAALL